MLGCRVLGGFSTLQYLGYFRKHPRFTLGQDILLLGEITLPCLVKAALHQSP